MILKCENGREVETVTIEGDVGEGAHLVEATFCDDGSEVPDHVLDWLSDHSAEELYDEWFQIQVGRAEAMADAYDDR